MNHFEYRDGVLFAEDVALPDIAAAVGTPFYCYSTATLTRHFQVFNKAFAGIDVLVCYALKANSNQAVIRTLAKLGAGADVVSEGELRRALAAGIPPEKIVFSGVGKTAKEMDLALEAGILCFNVESEPELELLSARAVALGKTAPVSLRINPDVDAKTHKKISTGKAEDKFGIPLKRAREVYAHAAILCHPAEFEGFGLAPAEALALKMPVVAFADCPGVNQFVADGVNGIMADRAGGAEALAAALDRLIVDGALRQRLGDNGPASVATFTEEHFADAWVELIERCLDRR